MTKADFMKRVEGLSEDQFAKVAPYLEADLDVLEELSGLLAEVEAGRQSRDTQPLLKTEEVMARVKKRLAK